MSIPLLSIITPILDRRELMVEAVESIGKEREPLIEHIVVDGGSTDGTIEMLEAMPKVELVKAPGAGIYEALNIGVAHSRGALIGLLNSDDLYRPGCLTDICELFRSKPETELISGHAEIFFQDRFETHRSSGDNEKRLQPRVLMRGFVAINARFFTRDLFDRLGGFDTRYRIAADRDFLMRAARLDPVHLIVNQVLYLYRHHAGSFTFGPDRNKKRDISREHLELIREHLADEQISAPWKKELKTAAAIETARLIWNHPGAAPDAMVKAVKTDPAFLLKLSAACVDAGRRAIIRGASGRSSPSSGPPSGA